MLSLRMAFNGLQGYKKPSSTEACCSMACNLTDKGNTTSLDDLPDVIVEYILSLLPWRERLLASTFSCKWEACLHSTGAWQCFTTNYNHAGTRLRLEELHRETLGCVINYGKYMQCCTIRLCYLDFRNMGLDLLDVVSQKCSNLRWFRLYHPEGCFAPGELSVLQQYLSLLCKVKDSCPKLKFMNLCGLDYVPVASEEGFEEIMNGIVRLDIHTKVRELEFSCQFSQPSVSLCDFMNLSRLKCPVQMLRTDIIILLGKMSLQDLHIQIDGSTLDMDFCESDWLDWHQVAAVVPQLQVAYIFTETTVKDTDLVPNPLVRTVVINSLCNSVTSSLLRTIADLYGKTLETFAHLALSWGLCAFENDYSVGESLAEFVGDCERLKKFVCGVEVDGDVPLRVAERGQHHLHHLWFMAECLQFDNSNDSQLDWKEIKLKQVEAEVSTLLGYGWKLLDLDTIVLQTRDLLSF